MFSTKPSHTTDKINSVRFSNPSSEWTTDRVPLTGDLIRDFKW